MNPICRPPVWMDEAPAAASDDSTPSAATTSNPWNDEAERVARFARLALGDRLDPFVYGPWRDGSTLVLGRAGAMSPLEDVVLALLSPLNSDAVEAVLGHGESSDAHATATVWAVVARIADHDRFAKSIAPQLLANCAR